MSVDRVEDRNSVVIGVARGALAVGAKGRLPGIESISSMALSQDPTRDRTYHVKRCVLWGVAVAAVYFPIGLLKYHLTIAPLDALSPQRWAQVFVLLLILGAGVGGVVGLLRPLLVWGKVGAALIEFIIAFPLLFIVFATDPNIQSSSIVPVLVVAALASAILGGGGGVWMHHVFNNDDTQ